MASATKPAAPKNYYDVLNIAKDATQSDVKKAYHKKALQIHPDKTGGTTTEEFKAVQEAYAILSDPEKRKVYDTFGGKGIEMADKFDFNPEMMHILTQGVKILAFIVIGLWWVLVCLLVFVYRLWSKLSQSSTEYQRFGKNKRVDDTDTSSSASWSGDVFFPIWCAYIVLFLISGAFAFFSGRSIYWLAATRWAALQKSRAAERERQSANKANNEKAPIMAAKVTIDDIDDDDDLDGNKRNETREQPEAADADSKEEGGDDDDVSSPKTPPKTRGQKTLKQSLLTFLRSLACFAIYISIILLATSLDAYAVVYHSNSSRNSTDDMARQHFRSQWALFLFFFRLGVLTLLICGLAEKTRLSLYKKVKLCEATVRAMAKEARALQRTLHSRARQQQQQKNSDHHHVPIVTSSSDDDDDAGDRITKNAAGGDGDDTRQPEGKRTKQRKEESATSSGEESDAAEREFLSEKFGVELEKDVDFSDFRTHLIYKALTADRHHCKPTLGTGGEGTVTTANNGVVDSAASQPLSTSEPSHLPPSATMVRSRSSSADPHSKLTTSAAAANSSRVEGTRQGGQSNLTSQSLSKMLAVIDRIRSFLRSRSPFSKALSLKIIKFGFSPFYIRAVAPAVFQLLCWVWLIECLSEQFQGTKATNLGGVYSYHYMLLPFYVSRIVSQCYQPYVVEKYGEVLRKKVFFLNLTNTPFVSLLLLGAPADRSGESMQALMRALKSDAKNGDYSSSQTRNDTDGEAVHPQTEDKASKVSSRSRLRFFQKFDSEEYMAFRLAAKSKRTVNEERVSTAFFVFGLYLLILFARVLDAHRANLNLIFAKAPDDSGASSPSASSSTSPLSASDLHTLPMYGLAFVIILLTIFLLTCIFQCLCCCATCFVSGKGTAVYNTATKGFQANFGGGGANSFGASMGGSGGEEDRGPFFSAFSNNGAARSAFHPFANTSARPSANSMV